MEETTFVMLADPQLGAFAAHSGLPEQEYDRYESLGITLPRARLTTGVDWELERLRRAVAAINPLQPSFVLVAGDMSHDYGDESQVCALCDALAGLDTSIAVHYVCGNHDIGQYPYRPTNDGLEAYRRSYGPDQYTIEASGWRLVVLNTCLLGDPHALPDEYDAQLDYLDSQLADHDGSRMLLVGHHPLFLHRPDEPDSIWNVCSEGRQPLLARIRSHGVRYALAGHRHRNVTARDGSFTMITSASIGLPFGSDPPGFGVVTLAERLSHRYEAV